MEQLTLLLATMTCRLSDIMKLIHQQKVLIKTLQVKGRPTAGAEALLAIFEEAASAITDQRKKLEGQMVCLTQKVPDDPNVARCSPLESMICIIQTRLDRLFGICGAPSMKE
jgi:hypothetical protein